MVWHIAYEIYSKLAIYSKMILVAYNAAKCSYVKIVRLSVPIVILIYT